MVKVNNLSHSFGNHWVLKNLSFSVREREFVIVTGHSGAGKTTLLQVLHGARPLQRGEAEIAGYRLSSLRPGRLHCLRRELGVVFQDFKILPGKSVGENVALALEVRGMPRAQIQRRVNAVLRGVQMESMRDVPCKHLSGGEQQRVAIARAIVVNPKILLADEPTGNLDNDLSLRLVQIFRKFNEHGTTVIMATHNQTIIEEMACTQLIDLDRRR
ncbi:MAG: ATP-binding cassette domain-containing protein [Desulfohalobiaceae bacterium]|nr:ATP-binding cassette domain-containing protein [Desulfohalobiaceae bacterium]